MILHLGVRFPSPSPLPFDSELKSCFLRHLHPRILNNTFPNFHPFSMKQPLLTSTPFACETPSNSVTNRSWSEIVSIIRKTNVLDSIAECDGWRHLDQCNVIHFLGIAILRMDDISSIVESSLNLSKGS